MKKEKRKIVIILIVIAVIVVLALTCRILYGRNNAFRVFCDVYIFRKEVFENNLATIHINEEDEAKITAYSKYIAVLSNNTLKIYGSSAKEEAALNIEISSPIFAVNGKYLAIAEKDGSKIYLVSDKNNAWQVNVEGEIKSITVNEDGYVAVSLSNTTYKSIVSVYNPNGIELFKQHLATKYVVDVAISKDSKNVAIAEANISGTLVESDVSIISIEKAELLYTSETKQDSLITNITYQNGNKLLCMYDNLVQIVENNTARDIISSYDKSVLFLDINLNNKIAKIVRQESGILDAKSMLDFISTNAEENKNYEIIGVPKSINSFSNVIAVNLGLEALFIRDDAWLIKKYVSSQEIQNIVLTNNIAGIIYKNKIEIISL
jgi:hypothetical protein